MARCAARHLLVSVPREPLWRARQHGPRRLPGASSATRPGTSTTSRRRRSSRSAPATARSSRRARRSPGRWCLSASERGAPLLRERRAHAVDRDRLDGRPDVRLLRDRRPPAAGSRSRAVLAPRRAVVGDVRDHQRDLPADRAAALADDRRAARRADRSAARCASRSRSRAPSRSLFLAVALPLHAEVAHHVLHSTTLYWILVVGDLRLRRELLRPRLARRPQVLRPLRRAGLHGVRLADRLRASPPRSGISHGQSAIALGIAAAPFVSLVVVPAAFATRAQRSSGRRRPQRRRARGPRRRGHRGGLERPLDPPRRSLCDLGRRGSSWPSRRS